MKPNCAAALQDNIKTDWWALNQQTASNVQAAGSDMILIQTAKQAVCLPHDSRLTQRHTNVLRQAPQSEFPARAGLLQSIANPQAVFRADLHTAILRRSCWLRSFSL